MTNYYKDKALIYKISGVLHNKILLYNSNYKRHISVRHKEMTLEIIEEVLVDPDFVYKPSKNSQDFYYEKNINDKTYRVILGKYSNGVKNVITAYEVHMKDRYYAKHAYCCYDKEETLRYKKRKVDKKEKLFYYELFNVAANS